jgi:hypothetical protein
VPDQKLSCVFLKFSARKKFPFFGSVVPFISAASVSQLLLLKFLFLLKPLSVFQSSAALRAVHFSFLVPDRGLVSAGAEG